MAMEVQRKGKGGRGGVGMEVQRKGKGGRGGVGMEVQRKGEGGRGGMEVPRKGKGGGDMEIWVKHYSSKHQILLVGEGDFSFSLSLAYSYGSARNITASSLDTLYELIKKYKKAESNLANLEKLGAKIYHGVDATKMKSDCRLIKYKFDRIVFNFPHAGFYGSEYNNDLIGMHRVLVEGFFRNAKDMLQVNGEVHVTHKTSIPFCNWDIEGLARRNDLAPIGYANFKIEDYLVYKNKRGAGNRSDEPFPLGECCTFKFGLLHSVKMVSSIADPYCFSFETSLQHHYSPFQVQNPNLFHFGYCPSTLAPIGYADFKIEDCPGYNNQRGAGNRSDKLFPLGECCAFKLGLLHSVKMVSGIANPYSFSLETPLQHHYSPFQVQNPNPFHFGYCPPTLATNADYTTEHSQFPSTVCVSSKGANGLEGHDVYDKNRTALYGINCPAHKVQWPEPERFMMEAPGTSQQLLSDPTKLQHLTDAFHPSHQPSFTTEVYEVPSRCMVPVVLPFC